MILKYRIKRFTFLKAKTLYIAQYNFLKMWLSINDRQKGNFTYNPRTYCESITDAEKRIELHKINMLRASEWNSKYKKIIKNL